MQPVKLIDLPEAEPPDLDAVSRRLRAFLERRRQPELLAAFFDEMWRRHEEEVEGSDATNPFDDFEEEHGRPRGGFNRGDLFRLRRRFRLSDSEELRIDRHARAFVDRSMAASGAAHLKPEERARLRRLAGEVPAIAMPSEHRADEIAAALHEEMPWMAPATDAVWSALRQSWRRGRPVRIGPLLLVGSPGIGKTAWARRLARQLGVPDCAIDASQGLASFALAGTERGWGSAQPGRPLATMLETRCANPVIFVDEIDKARGLYSDRGVPVSFTAALLGLLEVESARAWNCPYYRVRIDMSHLNWVLAANDLAPVPAPVRSRCRVLRIPDVTVDQLQGFAARQGEAQGLDAPSTDAVVETIGRAPPGVRARLSLRDVLRMLDRAEHLAHRPIRH